jgi:hypothetical protein
MCVLHIPWLMTKYSLAKSIVVTKHLIMPSVQWHVTVLLWFNYSQHFVLMKDHSGSVGLVTGCGPDGQGIWVQFWSWVRDFCLLHCVPLGPTQPPIQCVPATFLRDWRDWWMKLTAHFHSVPRLRMVELHFHCSIYVFMVFCLIN